MKLFYTLFLSIFLISCGAAVVVDYDKEVDFTRYKTFDFYPDIDSGLSDLDNKRIIRIADSLLQERGFVREESPQIFINFYARESVSNSRSTLGVGMGKSSGNVSVGVSGGIPIGGRVVNQHLTIDFVDVENDKLIWQAQVEGEMKERFSPEQKEGYYILVIKKMLKKYPPNTN